MQAALDCQVYTTNVESGDSRDSRLATNRHTHRHTHSHSHTLAHTRTWYVHILECNCASGLDLEKEILLLLLFILAHSFIRSCIARLSLASFATATTTTTTERVSECTASTRIICSPSSQLQSMPKQIELFICALVVIPTGCSVLRVEGCCIYLIRDGS